MQHATRSLIYGVVSWPKALCAQARGGPAAALQLAACSE